MKSSFLATICLCIAFSAMAQITDPKATEQWEPQPRIVTPGVATVAPSDAIVLFDGSTLKHWEHVADGRPVEWTVKDGVMTVKPGTGDIRTRENFGDCQIHIEWRTPSIVESEGQGRGNSGLFIQEYYEVQILDNFNNKTYANGQAGAVYKQTPPLVNACKGPGEWQTYDVIYKAPAFNADGQRVALGTVTVLHNGIVIQNHTTILGSTEYIGLPKINIHGPLPIKLQDHSNTMSFRNIWLRKL